MSTNKKNSHFGVQSSVRNYGRSKLTFFGKNRCQNQPHCTVLNTCGRRGKITTHKLNFSKEYCE